MRWAMIVGRRAAYRSPLAPALTPPPPRGLGDERVDVGDGRREAVEGGHGDGVLGRPVGAGTPRCRCGRPATSRGAPSPGRLVSSTPGVIAAPSLVVGSYRPGGTTSRSLGDASGVGTTAGRYQQ